MIKLTLEEAEIVRDALSTMLLLVEKDYNLTDTEIEGFDKVLESVTSQIGPAGMEARARQIIEDIRKLQHDFPNKYGDFGAGMSVVVSSVNAEREIEYIIRCINGIERG